MNGSLLQRPKTCGPHNCLVTTTNHLPPHLAGYLGHKSVSVFVWTSQLRHIHWVIKLSIFLYIHKIHPIIEYRRKMQWNSKRQAFLYVKYILSYPCDNCRGESKWCTWARKTLLSGTISILVKAQCREWKGGYGSHYIRLRVPKSGHFLS